MPRRKVIKKDPSESTDMPPVVKQVVEEVGVDTPPVSETFQREETSSEFSTVSPQAETEIPFMPEESEFSPASEDKKNISAEEDRQATKSEKEKSVVSELFQPQPGRMPPEITSYEGKSKKTFFIWALIVISIALLTGGGLLVIAKGGWKIRSMVTVKPTPTPTSVPTPTPVLLKQSDIKVQVLNGGGVPGAATKMKTFLENKGYVVSDVGNTDKYTYTKTEFSVKPGKEAYLELLKQDLKDSYSLGTSGATLSSDASSDAQVIVGKE